MKQILHIFRKDVRRLWIEILVSLCALVALCWFEWESINRDFDPKWYQMLAPFALPITWWLTIVRLLHGEPLVGNRQFWVTRPYEWKKLLAAKLLFIFVVLCIPLVAMQLFLLPQAGFSSAAHLAVIPSNLLTTGLFCILPFVAISSLTRNITQWILAALGLLLFVIGIAVFSEYFLFSNLTPANDTPAAVELVCFVVLACIATLLQFARRRTGLAWILMACGLLIIPIIMIATPYRTLLDRDYLLVGSAQNVSLDFPEPGSRQKEFSYYRDDERHATIRIPVRTAKIPADKLLVLHGVMISLNMPDGSHWDSEWQRRSEVLFPGDDQKFSIDLSIEKKVYEKVKSAPLNAEISLAMTELTDAGARPVVTNTYFEIPGVATCWINSKMQRIQCRSTEASPRYQYMVADPATSTCNLEDEQDHSKPNRALNTDQEDVPFSPIYTRTFYLPDVCPGTPLTFSTPEFVRRYRSEIELKNIVLKEYVPAIEMKPFIRRR